MDDATETKPAAPAKTEDKAAAARTAAAEAVVEQWVAGLRDGPIAHHTPAWNALTAALPGLKAAIINGG